MSGWGIAAIVVGGLVAVRVLLALVRAARHPVVAQARIVTESEHTEIDESGAVRSIQSADLVMPADRVEEIWAPEHLERLARTYWRFLSRCTLGLIRVSYTPTERHVVLLARPLVLLSFHAPEYEMDATHGRVRWRIARGLLVASAGRSGKGYLEIDVRRSEPDATGAVTVHVSVEVANFVPAIASRLSRFVYANTQSRIHVIVTHGFLRSLARLDLAASRVGRFAAARGAASRTAGRR
ncbi:MAG: hypothetical protein QOI91_1042 [Solirubrobacteraceae bacterium]|jgi:hypothetical protein|nr:hypothetical protein [Solirubrobacteraceae bacterium]